MQSEQDMADHIEFVQKQGRKVAADMIEKRCEKLLSELNLNDDDKDANAGANANANAEFVFAFKIKEQKISLTVGASLLPVFDLWIEFEMLHNQLVDVLIGPLE
jgi:hypothetical protein